MSKVFGIEVGRKAAPPPPPPPWRADFRRREALPDLKVVRTHFLLNYGTAALAFALAAYAGWNEYQYAELRGEIRTLISDIGARTADETKTLGQSGLWSEYAKSATEFVRFRETPVDCAKVLGEIGAVKNPDMVIRTISVDTAFFNPNTKRPEIRVAVIGRQKLDGDKSFEEVKEAYRRFRELKIWSEIRGRQIDAPPAPSRVVNNLQDHVIEFTFELSLREAGK